MDHVTTLLLGQFALMNVVAADISGSLLPEAAMLNIQDWGPNSISLHEHLAIWADRQQ